MPTKAKGPDGLNRRDPSTDETTPGVYNNQYIDCARQHPVVEVVTHQAVTR
jgi:hypothetical protein